MPDSDSLTDLINDIPADLADDDKNEDTNIDDDQEDQEDNDATDDTDAGNANDSDSNDEDESNDDETAEDESDESTGDNGSDDDNDDYITKTDLDEEDENDTTNTVTPPVANESEAEAKFVLDKLEKISVNIINAAGKVETVQVYGYGDLPRDYKGIATPYEAGVFQAAVTEQQAKARDLQGQYRQTQNQETQKKIEKARDLSIANDLKDLREEGIFPKFQGTPGTKQFDSSEGAKEFDKVIEFMNTRNAEYYQEGLKTGYYKNIGFKEAFDLLNPNIRENENKEDKARRNVARKLKSTQGSKATKGANNPKSVTNLTDLEEEFRVFAGSNNQ